MTTDQNLSEPGLPEDPHEVDKKEHPQEVDKPKASSSTSTSKMVKLCHAMPVPSTLCSS